MKPTRTSMFLVYDAYLFTYRFISGRWRRLAWFFSSSCNAFKLAYFSTSSIIYYDTTRQRSHRRRHYAGYHSNLNFAFLGMVVKGVSPGAGSVESDLFAIATVFSALQNITIIFLPLMAIIHRLPTIFSFLMIPKLNLVIGIFFAQTPGRLTDVVSRCISLLLWSLIGDSPKPEDAHSCSITCLPRYVLWLFVPEFPSEFPPDEPNPERLF